MKAILPLLVAALVAIPSLEAAFSRYTAFEGTYRGTVKVSSDSTVIPGTPSQGIFATSSPSKALLGLRSAVSSGGTTTTVAEFMTFNARRLNYVLVLGPSAISASGTVRGTRKKLRFSAVGTSSGSIYQINGTIRRAGRRVFVSTGFDTGSVSLKFSYRLRQRR